MDEVKAKKTKYIWNALRILFAAGALYLAFNKVDWPELGKIVSQVPICVLLCAVASYAASQLLFVARWFVLLKVQSIHIGYWSAVRLHFLGLFYSNVLPSSVGGDVLRAWYVTKHTEHKLQAAMSVVVDRIVGLLGLLLMSIGGIFFVPPAARNELFRHYAQTPPVHFMLTHKWPVLGFFVFFAAIGLLLILTSKGRGIIKVLVSKVSKQASSALSKLRQAVKIYYKKKAAILVCLLMTFLLQGVFIVGLCLIGDAIGANADWKYYFVFFPISWLLGTVPITPGGVGVVEWSVRVMFEGAQVSTNQASALALAQRVLWILGSLPGAFIHLLGKHLPNDFSIDCKETIN